MKIKKCFESHSLDNNQSFNQWQKNKENASQHPDVKCSKFLYVRNWLTEKKQDIGNSNFRFFMSKTTTNVQNFWLNLHSILKTQCSILNGNYSPNSIMKDHEGQYRAKRNSRSLHGIFPGNEESAPGNDDKAYAGNIKPEKLFPHVSFQNYGHY